MVDNIAVSVEECTHTMMEPFDFFIYLARLLRLVTFASETRGAAVIVALSFSPQSAQ